MKRFICPLIAFMALCSACKKNNQIPDNRMPEEQEQESGNGRGTLKGVVEEYVKDKKTGACGGATVQLIDKQGNVLKELKTDANGGYQFTKIPSGSYHIQADKNGWYSKPYQKMSGSLEQQRPQYNFTAGESTVVTAQTYKLNKKSTIEISSMRWYQHSTPEQGTGVYVDIVFSNWTPNDGDVSLYIFAGFDKNISKYNFSEKLSRNGVLNDVAQGYTPGYVIGVIPASKIVNGKVTAYRERTICGWLGGTLKVANPMPRYYAIYSVNTYSYKTDGLISDLYYEKGDKYSGISNLPPLVK